MGKWAIDKVALYTSAWIEIACVDPANYDAAVALYTSAWIEIYCQWLHRRRRYRRTLHECVD